MKLFRHSALTLFLAVAAVPAHGQQSAAPAETVYEAGLVSQLPRPLNQPAFAEAMNRGYPQALRDAGVPGTVQVRFVIGADGVPRDFEVTASTAEFLNVPAVEALSVLRFSPAQLDGRPVAMWAELPVKWEPAAATGPGVGDTVRIYELREVDRQPRIADVPGLARELERRYPAALRDAGVQGEVTVGMRISPEGVPHTLAVIQSDHPDFVQPSLAALSALRFEPAQIAGKPVWVWIAMPVQWRIGGMPFFQSPRPGQPGDSGRPVAVRPTLSNPEVLTRAMTLAHTELAGQQISWGTVVVQFRVGIDGVPDQIRVIRSADRRLDRFSIRAVEQLRFSPATVNGSPVAVPIQLPIDWLPR
jgi:TonB family protein